MNHVGLYQRVLGALLLCVSLLASNAQADEVDPWEDINRGVFSFNDTLDSYVLKPLAQGYRAVTPDPVEDSVHNFFNNLGELSNLGNNLLQAKFRNAGIDTSRMLFNSTLGVFGLFDVATPMGLKRSDEDLGQTLGYWGLSSGPYLVVPFFGPSTVRDLPNLLPEGAIATYRNTSNIALRNSLFALNTVDTRANLLEFEKIISGDKYIFVRNAYLQSREFKIKDGQVEDDF